MERALEHLETLSGDPDILYKHAANYALKLSFDGGAGAATYVADLEAPEEDEMAEKEGDGDEEDADETPPPPDDDDGADGGAAKIDYGEMFFRYVSAAGPKGHDQDWLVGHKLERGTGVSFALVDDEPKAPWIDIPNAMTFRGAPRPIPEGVDPPADDAEPDLTTVHFARGFPRVGAFFAVPITLETGEVAGMLCMDTLKTPTGGSGRAIREEDKDLMRRVATATAKAMDAAARTRAEILAAAEEEQAAIDAKIAEAEAPAEGDEATDAPADGSGGDDAAAADADPSPEENPEPMDGEEEEDAALRVALATAKKSLVAAEANLERRTKRFEVVRELIDLVTDEALAEMRSLPRAPKATWRVIKAGLYMTGHKKFEFETWSLTRKQIGANFNDELKALDPTDTDRNERAWDGVHRCLKGVKDKDVLKESKVGALLFRWVDAFAGVSDAAVEVKTLRAEIDRCETEIEKAAERKAEAAADAEAAAAAGETADGGDGGDEAPADE